MAKSEALKQKVMTASEEECSDPARDGKCSKLRHLIRYLREHYPSAGWWPAETPFEVAIGAVLTQNTSWKNVEKAIGNLKKAAELTPSGISVMNRSELETLLRPSGYFRQKAERVAAFSGFVRDTLNGDICNLNGWRLEDARNALLKIKGIGRETADSILLYACGMPSFVVDAYTFRLFSRTGITNGKERYDELKAFVEGCLEGRSEELRQVHALIVEHSKDICRKKPLCGKCFYVKHCDTGRSITGRQ